MKDRKWEYIGGHQWSLIEKTDNYDIHMATVEIQKGKYPIVGYLTGGINSDEVQDLLNIVKEEYE